MPFFKVMLEGNNFLIEFNGEVEKTGFLTTRWVEAQTPEKAELVAVKLVKKDKSLLDIMHNVNGEEPSPMIYLEEITQTTWLQYMLRKPGTGYSFYLQDEDREE